VSPFVLVDCGLNLEYVEGSQLGHSYLSASQNSAQMIVTLVDES
jgi:hypothetical protein